MDRRRVCFEAGDCLLVTAQDCVRHICVRCQSRRALGLSVQRHIGNERRFPVWLTMLAWLTWSLIQKSVPYIYKGSLVDIIKFGVLVLLDERGHCTIINGIIAIIRGRRHLFVVDSDCESDGNGDGDVCDLQSCGKSRRLKVEN